MTAPVGETGTVEVLDPAPDAAPDATPDAAPDELCDVCRHSLAAHDSIAIRYCDATQNNALARGCLCR
jgi:hypothetical protein